MIYCVEKDLFPTPEQSVEQISYKDENDFEWVIARVNNGFFVNYLGDPYFAYTNFEIGPKDGNTFLIKNTRCLFVANTDFETFADMRTMLKNGWTDDIWDAIEELLTERFNNDPGILKSEMV